MRYAHVVRFIQEQPWALLPETLATMVDVVRFRTSGATLTDTEIAARLAAVEKRAEQKPAAGVAVLGVYGLISQRADMFTEMSGGTSTERLTAQFRSAIADPTVRAVVLDVDSPGGGVYGVGELADEIRAARGKKPIVAVANSLAASAAYWIASAADEIVVLPGSEIGSIGVFSAHEDLSAALEKEGVKVTLVSAGKYKVEGNPFEALADEAKAAIQARVDDYYAAFVKAVAKGRGTSAATVKSDFGQGRVVGAKQALDAGMADRVGTLDDTVARLLGRRGQSASAAGLDVEIEAEVRRRRHAR